MLATLAPSVRPDVVPVDYEDLFQSYYPYVLMLVTKAGIEPQNAEDVTMSILEKFLSNNVLDDYDPSHTTQHDGVTRKAVFRTFLSGFVMLYLRHHRERQWVTRQREPISCDAVVVQSDGEIGTTWLEVNSPPSDEGHDGIYAAELIRAIRKHLATLPPLQMTCQLSELFESSLIHAREYGKADVALLAEQYGVSPTTIRTRQKMLRAEIEVVLTA